MELKNFGNKNTHIRAYKKKLPAVAAIVQMVTDLADQHDQIEFDLP